MRGPMIGATLATLVLAAGCSTYGAGGAPAPAPAPADDSARLEGTAWSLVDVGGQPARASGDAGTPTLRLDAAQKRAGGNTSCNSFGGGYTLSGPSLRFGALISTKRACLDPALNRQESAFLRALVETRTWTIHGDTLVLSGDAGQVARFAAHPAT